VSRIVELDSSRGELVISFPYQPELVQEIKNLPRRRWDPTAKVWRVPATDVTVVCERLHPLGFQFDEALRQQGDATGGAPDLFGDGALPAPAAKVPSAAARASAAGLGGSAGRRPAKDPGPTLFDGAAAPLADRPITPASPTLPDDTLTLSALTEQVDVAIKQAFPVPVWVVGEIVDLRPHGHRHMFFALVEKHEGEEHPRAKVDVAVFQRVAQELVPLLHDKGLDLQDGIAIRAKVRVDFWRQAGRFRLIVEDIDPAFTLGQLALDREKLLAELRAKGLDRRQVALELPRPPLRIGVLTSPNADGWNDFRRQLEESGFGFALTLIPVKVQGQDLKPTVLAGLRWLAERADQFDAVCILRGGGSRTDLAWFDDRDVAFAVAQHPLKILVGIGHERDRSVLDEIAFREKTPTALGVYLAGLVQTELDSLDSAARRIAQASSHALVDAAAQLREAAHGLGRLLAGRMAAERGRLTATQRELTLGVRNHLREAQSCWAQQRRRLHSSTTLHLTRQRGCLQHAAVSLGRSATRRLERAADRLERHDMKRRLLDPRRVLERGFSLVRDAQGRVVTDAQRIRAGTAIQVQMRDGRLRATVEEITAEPHQPVDPPTRPQQ